ncbi:MAG: Trm112 family protein [Anaerolineaceae bacterium]|nr:Trm112 family protein [Anaerolineaceae bacterium]
MLDPEFLKRLACPQCKILLAQDDDKLLCRQCGRRFPVRDGVPVLLIDEAETPPE